MNHTFFYVLLLLFCIATFSLSSTVAFRFFVLSNLNFLLYDKIHFSQKNVPLIYNE